MTYNDYVILVDENGTPYIAHGERYQRFKNNLKNSRAVKYLARFPNFYGMGKTAYAYTEQQLRNLRNGGRKAATAVKNTAKKAAQYVDDHDAGLTERMQANRLHRQSLRAGRKGDTNKAAALEREAGRQRIQGRKEYNSSSVKKAADTIEKYGTTSMNAIRGAAKKTGHAVKRAGRRVGQFVDDHDMGITERVQANRMAKRAKELESEGRLTLDGAERNKTMAAQLYREAGRLRARGRQEYENSIVGKAGNAAKNAASSASAAVKNAGKAVADKADDLAYWTKEAAELAGDLTIGTAEYAINKASKAIGDVIDRKITGSSASQNMSSSQRNAMMGLDGAIGDYMDAQQAYESTLKSGSKSAIKRAQQVLIDARENANELFNTVSGFFTSKEKKAVQSALNYELDPVTGEWVTKGR